MILRVLLLALLINFELVDCACTFPDDLRGTWTSSSKGSLTFTDFSLSNYETLLFGTLNFDCFIQSGDDYVVRSPDFMYNSVDMNAYLCLKLARVTSASFTYFLGTTETPTARNERIKVSAASSNLTHSVVCDRTQFDIGTYSILTKDGAIQTAKKECPVDLQAHWTYSYDNGTGNPCYGANSSSADGCKDTDTLTYDYTACPQKIMYSSSGLLYCLVSRSYGALTYLHLYNTDSTVNGVGYFRYTCMVYHSSSTAIYATQHPNECASGQTSTNVSSSGAYVVFTETSSCFVPTSASVPEKSYTAAIVAGILVPIAVIAIAAIGGFYGWKYYNKRKIEENSKPDPKYANGEVRNLRKNVHDGVVFQEKGGRAVRRENSIVINVPVAPMNGNAKHLKDNDGDTDQNDESDYEFQGFGDVPDVVVEEPTPIETPNLECDKAEKPKKKKRKKKRKNSSYYNLGYLDYLSHGGTNKNQKVKNMTSHLDTKNVISYGTSTLFLKMPEKKLHNFRSMQMQDPLDVLALESGGNRLELRVKELKQARKEKLAAAQKSKQNVVARHPMEPSSSKDNESVYSTISNGWVVKKKTAPSATNNEAKSFSPRSRRIVKYFEKS